MRVFDPVAGGEALVVINVGAAEVLAFFADPETGAVRLACGSWKGRCVSSTRSLVLKRWS